MIKVVTAYPREVPSNISSLHGEKPAQGRAMKVLVACSAGPVRRDISGTLKDDDLFDLVEVRNREDAVEVARREKPHLALIDVGTSQRRGIEICRAIKSNRETARTRVVLLTAPGQVLDREWVQAMGADGCVTEPISPFFLLTRVCEVLGIERGTDWWRAKRRSIRALHNNPTPMTRTRRRAG